MEWDSLFKTLRIQNWLILMLLGGASFFLMSPRFTLGVLIGGLLIIANFNVLQHTIRCGFSSEGTLQVSRRSIIVKFYLRLLAIGFLMYVLITRDLVSPVGLAVGLSIVVISIIQLALRLVWKTSSGEVV